MATRSSCSARRRSSAACAASASDSTLTAAVTQSAMLLLATVALVMPAVFELVEGIGLPGPNEERINYDQTVENLSYAGGVSS